MTSSTGTSGLMAVAAEAGRFGSAAAIHSPTAASLRGAPPLAPLALGGRRLGEQQGVAFSSVVAIAEGWQAHRIRRSSGQYRCHDLTCSNPRLACFLCRVLPSSSLPPLSKPPLAVQISRETQISRKNPPPFLLLEEEERVWQWIQYGPSKFGEESRRRWAFGLRNANLLSLYVHLFAHGRKRMWGPVSIAMQ